MLGNSSSSIFDDPLVYFCSKTEETVFISVSMVSVKILLILPLSSFILRLAYQRWRQQGSLQKASLSDVFTYHLAVMELFSGLGLICYLCGRHVKSLLITTLGMSCFSFTFFGEMILHLLTCVERYLAVVHPILYLRLRNSHGFRIRDVSLGAVWLLCVGLTSLHADLSDAYLTISLFCALVVCISVVTFCSITVLRVLTRSGPGEGGGERQPVNQSKLRAFHTITAISSGLWLWFLGLLVFTAMSSSSLLSEDVGCVLRVSANWLNLPVSLMPPLLYLQREGKLPCSWD